MRLRRLSPLLFLAVAGLAACEADDTADIDPALETPVVDPMPESTMPGATMPADAAPAAVSIDVAESPDLGAYLTDSTGRALYLLEGEPEGTSTCYDACAEAWPPLLAPAGDPTAAAPNVESAMLGTIERNDGTTQVTYNGHALYYYAEDAGPGQTMGQDVTDEWGEWYLVTPAGEHLEESGES